METTDDGTHALLSDSILAPLLSTVHDGITHNLSGGQLDQTLVALLGELSVGLLKALQFKQHVSMIKSTAVHTICRQQGDSRQAQWLQPTMPLVR